MESMTARGYSDAVIAALSDARALSTNRCYDSKWKLFKQFCSDRSVLPESAGSAIVADFLVFLFRERKCSSGTIASYRAAVGNVLRFTSGYDPAEDKVLSQLLKGFRRQRGPASHRVPTWDVSLVLGELAAHTFEDDTLHLLTAKAIFLVSLATAGRCHSLAALERDVDVSVTSPRSICIPYHRSHIPKQFFRLKHPKPVVPITIFGLPDGTPPGLCPVRVLLAYLERVAPHRSPSQTSLFVPHDLSKKTRVHPSAIGRYVVKTVVWAYEQAGRSPPEGVRAHDVRGIATSLRALTGVAISDVLAAGEWSQADTFTRFYLKDFPNGHLKSLGQFPVFSAAGGLIDSSLLPLQEEVGARPRKARQEERRRRTRETTPGCFGSSSTK
jgi:hypothetical protein